jgi:hypothetical protein
MGNGMVAPDAVDAIFDSFAGSGDLPFFERLMPAIEAGGEPIGHRSAGLIASAPGLGRPQIDCVSTWQIRFRPKAATRSVICGASSMPMNHWCPIMRIAGSTIGSVIERLSRYASGGAGKIEGARLSGPDATSGL